MTSLKSFLIVENSVRKGLLLYLTTSRLSNPNKFYPKATKFDKNNRCLCEYYFPVWSRILKFKVRAHKDVNVLLTDKPEGNSINLVEVIIGGYSNQKSVIRKGQNYIASKEEKGILSPTEFRGFWVRWEKGIISVGKEDEDPFMFSEDPNPFDVGYVGVCTSDSNGTWEIECMRTKKVPAHLLTKCTQRL